MFIEANEMDTVIADYQVQEITDYTPAILQQCIAAAVKRVSRLLSGRYDVQKIFSAVGEERDAKRVELLCSRNTCSDCKRMGSDRVDKKRRFSHRRQWKAP